MNHPRQDARTTEQLLTRGRALEAVTLGWNVVGVAVLAIAAVSARSIALAGFGLDSLIEIGASTVVLWELAGTGLARQRQAMRLIGWAFVALAVYLLVQSTWSLVADFHPHHSRLGIAWTAITAAVMFAFAAGKAHTGRALNNPVLVTEGRVTMIDGILAVAVLVGLVLNLALGWWWADPSAGYVLVFYALREAREIFAAEPLTPTGSPTLGSVPWWVWLLVGVGVLALAAFIFRGQLRYLLKVTKALATDERLPRPLRWGLKLALAMKVVPFPDFGIDEIILLVIGMLLVTVYRPTLRAILDESRATPTPSP